MKSHVILLVALTMLVKPLWPIAEYIMNYDYIVNVLCENKDRPELQCDGKCYLAQMLAEESEQNQNDPFNEERSKVEIQHLTFFESLVEVDLSLDFLIDKKQSHSTFKNFISTLFTTDFSQPPELS